MRKISIMIGMVLLVGCLWSWCIGGGEAPVKMAEDFATRPIQGIAPDPKKDVALTGSPQVINMTNDIAYECYSPTGGVFKMMSTATVAGTSHTVPTGVWFGDVVNHRSFSGGRAYFYISGAQDSGAEKATCRRQ